MERSPVKQATTRLARGSMARGQGLTIGSRAWTGSWEAIPGAYDRLTRSPRYLTSSGRLAEWAENSGA
jgi:hypothetical protein